MYVTVICGVIMHISVIRTQDRVSPTDFGSLVVNSTLRPLVFQQIVKASDMVNGTGRFESPPKEEDSVPQPEGEDPEMIKIIHDLTQAIRDKYKGDRLGMENLIKEMYSPNITNITQDEEASAALKSIVDGIYENLQENVSTTTLFDPIASETTGAIPTNTTISSTNPTIMTTTPVTPMMESLTEIPDVEAEITDAISEIVDATTEITDAASKITDAASEIADTKSEITNAASKITDAASEINNAAAELTNAVAEINDAATEIVDTPAKIKNTPTELITTPLINEPATTNNPRLAMDYNEVIPNQSSPSIQNKLPSSTMRIVTSKIPIYLNLKSTIIYQQETTSPSVVNSPKNQEFVNPQMVIPAPIQSHVNVIPMLIQVDQPQTSLPPITHIMSEPTINISIQAVNEPTPEKSPQEYLPSKRQKVNLRVETVEEPQSPSWSETAKHGKEFDSKGMQEYDLHKYLPSRNPIWAKLHIKITKFTK